LFDGRDLTRQLTEVFTAVSDLATRLLLLKEVFERDPPLRRDDRRVVVAEECFVHIPKSPKILALIRHPSDTPIQMGHVSLRSPVAVLRARREAARFRTDCALRLGI